MVLLRELRNKIGSCVVASLIVLGAWISQSDDQFNCWSHNRVVTVQFVTMQEPLDLLGCVSASVVSCIRVVSVVCISLLSDDGGYRLVMIFALQ